MESRRRFLRAGTALLLGSMSAGAAEPSAGESGAPGSVQPSGKEARQSFSVDAQTFRAAERLVQVELTDAELAQAASNWSEGIATVYERRTGPRRLTLPDQAVPWSLGNPLNSRGAGSPPAAGRVRRSRATAGALPRSEADIAYAPVWKLSQWIQTRQLSSERLTQIYLERIHRFDGILRSVITLTDALALEQARRADAEIAAGHYRGPLHGVPWGAKDLLDTAGIPTTYGAEPFRNRIPEEDSIVVRRLNAAGAVLVAKLSLGALALNDIWFGGQTMNPWLPEEGASGSSAGPAAAAAAGLVAFAIGSETEGSIVSPSMRCGITGLRPTFGHVPRTGAMTLCWSLDKLGPMARSVEDTMIVLSAIAGADPGDLSSVSQPLDFAPDAPIKGLKVGYVPAWMNEATDVDRQALDRLGQLGLESVPVALPDWPYNSLNAILFAESAAAFEELTLSGRTGELRMQTADAWPNTFRQSRFISAVDYVQADRLRRLVTDEMRRILRSVDLLIVPSLHDDVLTIGNFTGLPSLTLRAGYVQISEARSDWAPDPAHPLPRFDPPRRVPHGVTLLGRHFDEGTITRVGLALERSLNVAEETPAGF